MFPSFCPKKNTFPSKTVIIVIYFCLEWGVKKKDEQIPGGEFETDSKNAAILLPLVLPSRQTQHIFLLIKKKKNLKILQAEKPWAKQQPVDVHMEEEVKQVAEASDSESSSEEEVREVPIVNEIEEEEKKASSTTTSRRMQQEQQAKRKRPEGDEQEEEEEEEDDDDKQQKETGETNTLGATDAKSDA